VALSGLRGPQAIYDGIRTTVRTAVCSRTDNKMVLYGQSSPAHVTTPEYGVEDRVEKGVCTRGHATALAGCGLWRTERL